MLNTCVALKEAFAMCQNQNPGWDPDQDSSKPVGVIESIDSDGNHEETIVTKGDMDRAQLSAQHDPDPTLGCDYEFIE